MKLWQKLSTAAASLLLTATLLPMQPAQNRASAYGTGNEVVEHLNRGISAINTGKGMLVSWRYNADDADDAVFQLYRGEQLIYTAESGKATCFLDINGNASSQYRVDTIANGQVISSEQCSIISDKNYFDIPLNPPKNGSNYSYMPADCSCGDVDGDGTYEIIIKWDPTNAADNSQSGTTGNVYLECVRLNGQSLWRIDLGKNIRAGAHYTQFLVADFDLDGKAEVACKTADGTVDGQGRVIGDASKDYRNPGGYILSGSEYYTLFDGMTGSALDTVDYEYPRGEVSKQTWGDAYGNRVDRFLGTTAYLDGVHPSIVSVRGYYTRMTAVAYDVINKKLVKRWGYDTGYDPTKAGYANGNHNCMPADVDGDGKQEIVLGATCIDDDGKVLWCNRKGHGDAMHLGDFIPERPGQELWVCHEHTPFGVSLIDARTGQDIFHKDGDKDTGRCCAANIYAGNAGCEFWGARPAGVVMDQNGNSTGIQVPSMNFLIYWDGDLEREIQSGTGITTINANKKVEVLLQADGCESNNSTKATPNLTADLFGDWREELILRTSNNKALRVFCTPYQTDVRLTTLMHDTQYRMQVATEQNCYNQPPHTSFYLGSDRPLPERPAVNVLGAEKQPETPVFDYHTGDSEAFLPGDLNHDGRVNAVDMSLMKRHMTQGLLNRYDCQRADLNADGNLNMADMVSMQKYLLHLADFPLMEENKAFQYAIDAAWNEGVTETNNAGYMQEAYLNLHNKAGSYVEWNIYAPTAGNYLCTFGTANGSADNRQMNIIVNDDSDGWTQDFLTTGAWTTWQERGIVLPLNQGENRIKMISLTAQGGPNFDYLKAEWTDEPVADKHPQVTVTQPATNGTRTIYIAGDSTVQTYKASAAPQQGWGAYLGENLSGVNVSNHAIAGRSSKSFYDNGRLDSILNNIKAGDYLLVQFGINDAAASKPERYAPTCGSVPGTAGSFEDYMAKYIEGALAKNATPIMVTTVIGLKSMNGGKFVSSYGNYCESMKKLAAYYKIPVIDLNTMMVNHYNQIGYDAAYKYHMCSTGSGDTTHFTETGAKAVAKLVADAMKQQGLA